MPKGRKKEIRKARRTQIIQRIIEKQKKKLERKEAQQAYQDVKIDKMRPERETKN